MPYEAPPAPMPAPAPVPAPASGSVWDTLTRVFTSGNALFILGTIVILVLLFGIFAKLGVISVHKKGIKIGKTSALSERAILRKQIDYVQKYCLAIAPELAKIFEHREFRAEGEDTFYFRYIALLISNEMEQWVLFNNVSQSANYIQTKQLELKAYIVGRVGDGEYSDAALTKAVNKWVSEVLTHIGMIRKVSAPN